MLELFIDTKQLEKDIYLISLNGILNNETSGTLLTVFRDLFVRKIWKFVVDLSKVNYMGSPGIGLFISFIDSLDEHKGAIVFVNPKPTVKEAFKIFKLSNFYSITKNLKSAVDELKNLTR
ncbi:MAG: STAS domain-containing protein [Planctomycetota bacterium]